MEIHIESTPAPALPVINVKATSPLKSLSLYQQELKQHLPQEVFQRVPSRVFYLISFMALNIALIATVIVLNPAWYYKLAAGLIIGQLNASMAFFAHEVLHGSVFKSKWLQDITGFIGFGAYLMSPTYWRFWHNTLHHGNTQLIYKDPDAFPTMSVYKRSKLMRVIFELSPGSKNILSYGYLFYWFSWQSVMNQTYLRFKSKMWEKLDQKQVTLEFTAVVLLGAGYLYLVGFENLLWLVVIPLMIQNYIILSYIITNHNISPLTKVNDPLVNSLSVTNDPLSTFVHMNFGYHVEHHLFPRVSPKHAKKIHLLLNEMYPEKYLCMPKWRALKYIYMTPRIYKNSEELVHPHTLETFPTLSPRTLN